MIKNVKWFFVVLMLGSLISYSFVGKDTPTEGLMIGDKAPDFTLGSGQRMSLNDLQGKYVLLSFWASYDAPSRQQNATLNHVVRQTGHIEMVSVSFDEYSSIFNESVRKDRLSSLYCFVELAGAESDLYETYRLKRGFRNYLLNADGVIIAKDVTASELASYLDCPGV